MASGFTVGSVTVGPGELGRGTLGSVELADGSRPGIPLIVARGATAGPTLVVMAAVHGTEVCCIGAIHRLMAGLDLGALRGTVIAIPAANPIAVAHGDYGAWPDGLNMSATWPEASPTGGLTQRMAALIWPVIELGDCVLDIHANPLPAVAFTLVSKAAGERAFRLARAFGVTVVKQAAPSNYSRGMREMLAEKGVPVICPELPGNIHYSDEIAAIGERGVRNIMKELGMLDGAPERQDGLLVLEGEMEFVARMRANRGGLLRATAPPGTRLAKGATAAEVYSLAGELLEEIKMPCDGYCWSFSTGAAVRYSAVVSEGQRVGYVFREVREASTGS
jgi:predicted deacylase